MKFYILNSADMAGKDLKIKVWQHGRHFQKNSFRKNFFTRTAGQIYPDDLTVILDSDAGRAFYIVWCTRQR